MIEILKKNIDAMLIGPQVKCEPHVLRMPPVNAAGIVYLACT